MKITIELEERDLITTHEALRASLAANRELGNHAVASSLERFLVYLRSELWDKQLPTSRSDADPTI